VSNYTTEVRYICEMFAGLQESKGYTDVDAIIKKARPLVFNFDYTLFDPLYKPQLETKILRHYYTREIGFETIALWQLKLQTKLNEILPYYNQLYQSAQLRFEPFYDTDFRTDYAGKANFKNDGTYATDSTTDRDSEYDTVARSLYSDTPQGALNGVENEEYLTSANKDLGNGTNNQTTTVDSDSTRAETGKSENEHNEHIYGKRGVTSYSKMLQEYRETFLNIDLMVINELNDLFFGLWTYEPDTY